MGKLRKEVEKAQKCTNLSDVVDTYFTEPVALVFSKLFIRLGIGPNAVTVFSMITGAIGGLFFVPKVLYLNVIGILLEILAAVFDASDGQVARLTNKKSDFGRFLDGLGDGVVYASIYFGITVHLMTDYIPFTNTLWGYWIIPITLVFAIYYHSEQAKVADYCRTVHMFFISNKKSNELTSAEKIKEDYQKHKKFSVQRIVLRFYYTFTKREEHNSPKMQKLLQAIRNSENGLTDEISQAFSEQSSKVVRITNLLTYSLRSYFLFALIIANELLGSTLGLQVFLYALVLFVLEPIKIFLSIRYEKIAENVYNRFYGEVPTAEQISA